MPVDANYRAMFKLSLGFLFKSQLQDALSDVQNRIMYYRGRDDGYAAGLWTFDGNTSDEAIIRIIKGMNDGDPEILDELPQPRLSGEYADDPSWPQILEDELHITMDNHAFDEDDWLNSYEFGFSEGRDEAIHEFARGRDLQSGLDRLYDGDD